MPNSLVKVAIQAYCIPLFGPNLTKHIWMFFFLIRMPYSIGWSHTLLSEQGVSLERVPIKKKNILVFSEHSKTFHGIRLWLTIFSMFFHICLQCLSMCLHSWWGSFCWGTLPWWISKINKISKWLLTIFCYVPDWRLHAYSHENSTGAEVHMNPIARIKDTSHQRGQSKLHHFYPFLSIERRPSS